MSQWNIDLLSDPTSHDNTSPTFLGVLIQTLEHDEAYVSIMCVFNTLLSVGHVLTKTLHMELASISDELSPIFFCPVILHEKNYTTASWSFLIIFIMNTHTICNALICNRCSDDLSPDSFTVVTGEHDLLSSSGKERTYNVEQIFIYPGWNAAALDGDAALVKLTEDIVYNAYTRPVCMPETDTAEGTTCFNTGWGNTQGLYITIYIYFLEFC